jgi:plasmid stabilization system protein ParE
MRLVLRLLAKADLREARDWYEARQTGLGQSFLECVEATLSLIQDHPQIYPKVDPAVRRASIDRFPFGIFYRVDGETVRVIAVLHKARNPEHWQRRK